MSVDDVVAGNADHHLHRGDALALLRELPDGVVDSVITDPPYSSGGQFRGDRMQLTTAKYVGSDVKLDRPEFVGDTRDSHSFRYWCQLWISEALRATRPGGTCLVFTDWRQLPSMTDALQAGGWVWRGIVVWDKQHARPVLGRFTAQSEFVVWGSNGPMPRDRREIFPGVYRVPVRAEQKHHITGKPLTLMRSLVKICRPGGLVLDPFAGGGTTGAAALLGGLRFIGCELSKEYFEIAGARLEKASQAFAASKRR